MPKKGPCHIWTKKTEAEKKTASLKLDKLNKKNEPQAKLNWQISNGLENTGLRNLSGRKLT